MNIWKDFHPSSETVTQWLALGVVAIIAFLLIFFEVPISNKELITFALGGIVGALSVGGNRKTADKVTTSGDIQGDVISESETRE